VVITVILDTADAGWHPQGSSTLSECPKTRWDPYETSLSYLLCLSRCPCIPPPSTHGPGAPIWRPDNLPATQGILDTFIASLPHILFQSRCTISIVGLPELLDALPPTVIGLYHAKNHSAVETLSGTRLIFSSSARLPHPPLPQIASASFLGRVPVRGWGLPVQGLSGIRFCVGRMRVHHSQQVPRVRDDIGGLGHLAFQLAKAMGAEGTDMGACF
jgi:hypothetical protein